MPGATRFAAKLADCIVTTVRYGDLLISNGHLPLRGDVQRKHVMSKNLTPLREAAMNGAYFIALLCFYLYFGGRSLFSRRPVVVPTRRDQESKRAATTIAGRRSAARLPECCGRPGRFSSPSP